MLKRKMTQWVGWMVYISGVSMFLILTSCGGGQATPGAVETAEARRVMATLTAEVQTTPTPSSDLEGVAQEAFEAWAQGRGEPYRDVVVTVGESDGYFAVVQVVAWFRPGRDAPWEEREAKVECRLVGEEWQCDQWFDFQLTAREVMQRAQATATAEAHVTVEAQTTATAEAQAVATLRATAAAVTTREQVWEKDDSVMVYVPASEFLMGSALGEGDDDEHPMHTVYVSEFWIDKTEVTNAQYRKCVETGPCWVPTICDWGEPTYFDSSKADHPVVCVSWWDAKTYCEWAGKRVPTEAEWEKAARGTDGRKYPWGDDFDCHRGNFDDETEVDDHVVPGGEGCDGYVRTAPVGSFTSGASPYGALDMAGNVREWCQDWYDYYTSSPQHDPQGPSSGTDRVVRGGSWRFEKDVRATSRHWYLPDVPSKDDIGFRCVSQSPP